MPDPTTDPALEPTADPQAAQQAGENTLEYWKSQARKWEKRSKENSSAQEELEQLKNSQNAALEEALKKAKTAEEELAALKSTEATRALKAKVAADVGIPEALIHGATEEEMRSAAEAMVAYFKPKAGAKVPNPGKFTMGSTNDNPKREVAAQLFGHTN